MVARAAERRRLQRGGRRDRPAARSHRGGDHGNGTTRRSSAAEGAVLTVDGEPIENLSEGYRSVIGMACDLMAGAGTGPRGHGERVRHRPHRRARRAPAPDAGRWRSPAASRRIFPSMQFVVSTHEPLCLLGLEANEVIPCVYQSPRTNSTSWRSSVRPHRCVAEPLPRRPPAHVGRSSDSNTTIDPGRRARLPTSTTHSMRKADPDTPTSALGATTLRARLSQHGVLGYTARDQMVYEAIDQYLAQEDGARPRQHGSSAARQTLRQVGDIWRSVAERRQATVRRDPRRPLGRPRAGLRCRPGTRPGRFKGKTEAETGRHRVRQVRAGPTTAARRSSSFDYERYKRHRREEGPRGAVPRQVRLLRVARTQAPSPIDVEHWRPKAEVESIPAARPSSAATSGWRRRGRTCSRRASTATASERSANFVTGTEETAGQGEPVPRQRSTDGPADARRRRRRSRRHVC